MESKSVWKGLVYGGFASCMAEIVTLPIDVTKVRLQLQGELGAARQYRGFFDAIVKIPRTEGIGALWKGMAPALLRQASYGRLLHAPCLISLVRGCDFVFWVGNHRWQSCSSLLGLLSLVVFPEQEVFVTGCTHPSNRCSALTTPCLPILSRCTPR